MDETNITDYDDIKKNFLDALLLKKNGIEMAISDLKENHRLEDQNRSSGSSFEEIDRADNEMSAQQYYGHLERKYSELKKIEKLIKKIDQNEDFGWCEDCGERISEQRLSVMPDATRCIECQREYEKMELRKSYAPVKYKESNVDIDQEEEDSEDSQGLRVFIGSIGGDAVSMDDLEEIDLGDEVSDDDISPSSDLDDEDEMED